MPKRIPLIAGLVVASATAVYAVRPNDGNLKAFEIDLLAAEYCQTMAIDSFRSASGLRVTKEKVKTPARRSTDRLVTIVVAIDDEQGQLRNFAAYCHTTWTHVGPMLIEFEVRQLPTFTASGKSGPRRTGVN